MKKVILLTSFIFGFSALGAVESNVAASMISPLGKSTVMGDAKLTGSGTSVKLSIRLKGLSPNSVHGFHVHELGNCSSADGSSAGGHYNPSAKEHGDPTGSTHHAGDLGNLTADSKGEVAKEIEIPKAEIKNFLNRALIVHAKADDLKSQPAGASGDRIACGVIKSLAP